MKRSRLLTATAIVLMLTAFSFGLGSVSTPPSNSQPAAESSDKTPPPPSEMPDEGFAVRCC